MSTELTDDEWNRYAEALGIDPDTGDITTPPVGRILWNTRGDDIDEIVLHNATVHIEQMHDRCWWIGIDIPGGGYWAGNFHCDSRGRMTFTEQEAWGPDDGPFPWDQDDSHDDYKKAHGAVTLDRPAEQIIHENRGDDA